MVQRARWVATRAFEIRCPGCGKLHGFVAGDPILEACDGCGYVWGEIRRSVPNTSWSRGDAGMYTAPASCGEYMKPFAPSPDISDVRGAAITPGEPIEPPVWWTDSDGRRYRIEPIPAKPERPYRQTRYRVIEG